MNGTERQPEPEKKRPTPEELDARMREADLTDRSLAEDVAAELPAGWASNLARLASGHGADADELNGEISALVNSEHVTERARVWATWLHLWVAVNTNEDGELPGGRS